MSSETNKSKTATYSVVGMSCASCAARINKVLSHENGVYEAQVNYAASTVCISFDSEQCSPEQLKAAVQHAGYDLLIDSDTDESKADKTFEKEYVRLKRQTIASIVLVIPIMVVNMFFMDLPYVKYVVWLMSSVVLFAFGRRFYINAWKQLKHFSANMDTLVAISTGIAYLFSLFNLFFPEFLLSRGLEPHIYFESASVIIAFILLGRLLEARAKQKTSVAIKKLMGLQPKTVTVETEKGEKHIPVEQAQTNDIIIVKPGERIALDGVVLSGDSYVDESMLTGEPLSVFKTEGAHVYAGTINGKGAFRFKASKTGGDTMLAQIIRMVQEAQGSKAPVQQMVDKVAGVFVPVIIGISVLVFLLWLMLAPTYGLVYGIMTMTTVLIIACPCALGLATPTALIVGIGKGAESGILIKDAASLEVARKVSAIVLDKTGTITEGRPIVTNECWVNESLAHKSILYTLEKLSEHPLATALTDALSASLSKNPQWDHASQPEVNNFENIPGKGVKGTVQGETYFAGNYELLQSNRIQIGSQLQEQAVKWQKEAKTIVWFSDSSQAIAVLALADKIKDTSAHAISALHEQNIHVYMLTGDNEATAEAVAAQIGIKHYQAHVLPQDKALFIKKLQSEGHVVAMVGDGINDSAALAQADLSIAMGKGSDIAMDTAMVTILSSDLTKVSDSIRLSQFTIRTIRQNLFWASVYNLIAVPIAAGILYPINGFLLNPMIGGAAMAFSSVSVVSNSLRLRKKKLNSMVVERQNLPEQEQANQEQPKQELSEQKQAESEQSRQPAQEQPVEIQEESAKYRYELQIKGMMCMHCRANVEEALNSMEGVQATVTLEPPLAVIESDRELSLEELQQVVREKAGRYTLFE